MQKLVIHAKVARLMQSTNRKEVIAASLKVMAGKEGGLDLCKLICWALKVPPDTSLPGFSGGFDRSTGAFWINFPKDTYFNYGGRQVLSDLLERFNSEGWPMVSFWGSDYWAGAFPRKVEIVMNEVVEIPQTQQPVMQVQAAKKVEAPKVIRGRRNPKSAVFVPVDDIE